MIINMIIINASLYAMTSHLPIALLRNLLLIAHAIAFFNLLFLNLEQISSMNYQSNYPV